MFRQESSMPGRSVAARVLPGALLALASAIAGVLPQDAVAAAPAIEPLKLDDFDTAGIRHLAQDQRIAVATYRIGVVTRGSARVRLSEDTLHGIAERAYGDLVRRLRATGREVVPASELRELPAYKAVSTTRHRMHRATLAEGGELELVAGEEHDLMLTQLDAAIASGDSHAEDNGRALGDVSTAINAVVLVPTVVIEAGEQGMSIAAALTSLAVYHATGRNDEQAGQAVLRAPAPLAASAATRKLDEDLFDDVAAAVNAAFVEAATKLRPN
jgi:hypothetical protein